MSEPTIAEKFEVVIRKLHNSSMWTMYQTEAQHYEDMIDSNGGAENIKGHLYLALAYRKSIDHANEDRKNKLTDLQLQVHNAGGDISSLVNDILGVITDPNY